MKEKKPFYKRVWFWAVALIVVFIYIGSTAEENAPEKVETTSPTNATEVASSKASENNVEPEVPTEFKVGDTVKLGDNAVTVTKVVKSGGDEYDKPKSGYEYVIVHVKIENAGDQNISYNSFDFKMVNSEGNITDTGFILVDVDTALNSGELAPGGKVTGTLSFEQPKGDDALQLQYSPSFFSSDLIKINL